MNQDGWLINVREVMEEEGDTQQGQAIVPNVLTLHLFVATET
jgi:hypothetical protein